MSSKVGSYFKSMSQKLGAMKIAPSSSHIQLMLFVLGAGLLAVGLTSGAFAQGAELGQYNDERISQGANLILMHMSGSFGALIMILAGLGAIISSAFGQYRAALGMLVVAIGTFILRSIVGTFFNAEHIGDGVTGSGG